MKGRRIVRVRVLLGCLFCCAALVAAGQAGPESVVTIRDGTIYHLRECISMTGHEPIEVPDRMTLGPQAVACSRCRPDQLRRVQLIEPVPISASLPLELLDGTDPDACDSMVRLDEKGADFLPWLKEFVAHVKRNWFVPFNASSQRGRIVVTFKVHRYGTLTNLKLVQATVDEAAVIAALNAIDTGRSLPLPPEYPDDTANFTVTICYNTLPSKR